jgi:hypothetical protein
MATFASVGEAYLAVAIERRLWSALQSFPRQLM